jgi:hypothetical protein
VPGTEAYAVKAPELSMSYGDGRFRLRYSAPADIGALVEQAVREAKDALFTAGQPDASYADGLAEVAARSLAAVESAGSSGSTASSGSSGSPDGSPGSKGRSGSRLARYRVYVHLSTDGAWVGGRGAIRRRWRPSSRATGSSNRSGRRTGYRSVSAVSSGSPRTGPDPPADRGPGSRLPVPGCTATRFLEVHHLDHWKDGGNTDLNRQVCLCPHHHDAHHRGEYTITGQPPHPGQLERLDGLSQGPGGADRTDGGYGLVFTTARGLRIGGPRLAPAPHADAADTADRAETDREPRRSVTDPYRGPTGERLEGRWLDLPPNRPALTVVRDWRPESDPAPDPDPDPDLDPDPEREPNPDAGASPPGGAAPLDPSWLDSSAFGDWEEFGL